MIQKVLVFETNVDDGGHHLEYLFHYYNEACKRKDISFVFVVPKRFEATRMRFTWPTTSNVEFDYIDDAIVNRLASHNHLYRFFKESFLIRSFVVKHKVSLVFLSKLISYVIFLPFLLPRGVKVSGIIYNIYLYSWGQLSIPKRLRHVFLHCLMTKCRVFDHIFVLNDSSASAYLNKLYKTTKYIYVPDPIISLPYEKIDYREQLNLPNNACVCLQCGMQTRRKMSLSILQAAKAMSCDDHLFFVFAGKIMEDIRSDFYELANSIPQKQRIIIIDKHLSYEEMLSLIDLAQCVFVLYENNSQSSGFIGHASMHGKPVIARNDGLIGKLVRRYRLGFLVDEVSTDDLISVIHLISNKTIVLDDKYKDTHTPELFTNSLFDN